MKIKSQTATLVLKILRIVSITLMISSAVVCYIYFKEMTPAEILVYTPSNTLLASLFILLLYALKSLTVVFPITVLYIATGMVFNGNPGLALLVNSLGILICVSVPYVIGLFSGKELTDRLVEKYPKAKQLEKVRKDNELFFTYLVKLIGIIPCDISSLLLGAMAIKYANLLIGSLIGMFPYMAAITLLGANFRDPFSPAFFISFGAVILLSLASILIYRRVFKTKE